MKKVMNFTKNIKKKEVGDFIIVKFLQYAWKVILMQNKSLGKTSNVVKTVLFVMKRRLSQ